MNKFQLEGTVAKLRSTETKGGALLANFLVRTDGQRPHHLPVQAWDDTANTVITAGDGAHGKFEGDIRRRKFEKDGQTVWETTLTCQRYTPTKANGKSTPTESSNDDLPF